MNHEQSIARCDFSLFQKGTFRWTSVLSMQKHIRGQFYSFSAIFKWGLNYFYFLFMIRLTKIFLPISIQQFYSFSDNAHNERNFVFRLPKTESLCVFFDRNTKMRHLDIFNIRIDKLIKIWNEILYFTLDFLEKNTQFSYFDFFVWNLNS
jgi:hypothetical protein